jgi:2-methylcitrate dehydratase PrpD
MSEITQTLADHATSLRYEDLPREVADKACELVLDLVGIGLRASAEAASTPPIRDTVLTLAGPGSASMFGEARQVHPAHAALLNGALAHSLDFDDTHRDSSLHPGAAVIPAVLALAEHHGIGGERAVAAIVAGYDVTCKLGMAITPKSHYDRGFHPTATLGVFGATAAGANLLGLSAEKLVAAFGINGSQAAGSLQFLENGSYNKRLHPGLAAHSAILALELARNGFVGSTSPIEGPRGLLRGYSDAAAPERAVAGLRQRWEIMHTAIKPYPSCRYSHAGLDIVCDLVAQHELLPDEIQRVRVGLCDAAVDLIGAPLERKRRVGNIVDGQFSMPFVTAVALTRGRMTWGDYELVGDAGIDALMRHIDVAASAEANAAYPKRWLTSVEIETGRGTFGDARSHTRGEPEYPLSFEEVRAKFDDLASVVLDEQDRAELAEAIRELPSQADLDAVGAGLRNRVASVR